MIMSKFTQNEETEIVKSARDITATIEYEEREVNHQSHLYERYLKKQKKLNLNILKNQRLHISILNILRKK